MSKPSSFLFNVENWLASDSIDRMSGDQVKAYLYLLCKSWHQTPPATLPNDDRELARMARLPLSEWDQIKADILDHFESDGNGRIVNLRLKKEADFCAAKSFAGQSGWTTGRRKKQSARAKKSIAKSKHDTEA